MRSALGAFIIICFQKLRETSVFDGILGGGLEMFHSTYNAW